MSRNSIVALALLVVAVIAMLIGGWGIVVGIILVLGALAIIALGLLARRSAQS